jgi:hypothetical protein
MDAARINYPHPEEVHRFLKRLFAEATERALEMSGNYGDRDIADLLGMLEGAIYPDDHQSSEGATLRSLAHVAHLYGLTREQRSEWYGVAKSVPLSQGHVSYLINNVQGRNRLLEEAESLLGKG